jgi:hypothetical protein
MFGCEPSGALLGGEFVQLLKDSVVWCRARREASCYRSFLFNGAVGGAINVPIPVRVLGATSNLTETVLRMRS